MRRTAIAPSEECKQTTQERSLMGALGFQPVPKPVSSTCRNNVNGVDATPKANGEWTERVVENTKKLLDT